MQYDESILEAVRQALFVTLKITAPILFAGLVVGIVISIAQAVTSIQDQALTFVPKLLAMLLALVALLPWVVASMVAFATEMFTLQ